MNIIGMTKERLLRLRFQELGERLLTAEEVVYIAETLGAFWRYDYRALEEGRPGLHAELKSGLHSDGFFVSRILLEHPNIEAIIASQMAKLFKLQKFEEPSLVIGIPDGATRLGRSIAGFLNVSTTTMNKINDKMVLLSGPVPGDIVLLVEDFCTRGTGFKEAVKAVVAQRDVRVLPIELVIINRGGLQKIEVEGVGNFTIVPLAEHRINDWPWGECPLCRQGSEPIKPKAIDKNWQLINASQEMKGMKG